MFFQAGISQLFKMSVESLAAPDRGVKHQRVIIMLDETASQNLFDHVQQLWVGPELERRRQTGSLPKDFKVLRCLVRFPKGHEPIIEFNEEISWEAIVKTAKGVDLKNGEAIYLPQIDHIDSVAPPLHNGVRVAFLFLYWNGISWGIIFDFAPNSPSPNNETEDSAVWKHGRTIANYYNQVLREYAIHYHDKAQVDLELIAMWPAPALLPYPFGAICEHCKNRDPDEALKLLVEYCNIEFLANLVASWDQVPAFTARAKLFDQALAAHTNGHYILSVSALVPHIEGVITDWVHEKLPAIDVPWRQQTKTKKFRDLVAEGAQRTFLDQRVADSVIAFILDGPVLDTFTDWLSPISSAFPNRNVVGHGKYEPSLYIVENSIKMFLMFDTLYRIMAAQVTPDV